MSHRSVLPADRPVYDLDVLRALRGSRLGRELKVLCVVGAHRFDELPLINRLFPSLDHIYLFEPQPGPLAALQALAQTDRRLRVFPFAVSDSDGTASFHIASNEGESSSLLKLGSHATLFPEVTVRSTIEVPTRRLDSVLREHALPLPDALIVDVQGAEYLVLKSLPRELLAHVRLVYSEVSTEAVYEGAGLLGDVEAVLAPRFVNVGYAALRPGVPMHGNALFLAESDIGAALDIAWRERLRRAFHDAKRRLRGR